MAAHASDWGDLLNKCRRGGKQNTMVMMFVGVVVLYNGWEEWIVSKGKEIAVGDGTKKTFHYIMGSWYDEETPESKEKIDESEDDDTFGNDGG